MSSNVIPDNNKRLQELKDLARSMRNITLAPVQRFKNPYRDVEPSQLTNIESSIKDGFLSALLQDEVPVLLWVNSDARRHVSLESATVKSCRGNLMRISVKKSWFEANWTLLAGEMGPKAVRDVFCFIKYTKVSLASLAAPWWDPAVLTNPSVSSSPSLIREVKKRVEPGTIAFSLAMGRLRSCVIHMHPDDVDTVTECVYACTHRGDFPAFPKQ